MLMTKKTGIAAAFLPLTLLSGLQPSARVRPGLLRASAALPCPNSFLLNSLTVRPFAL